MAKQEWYKLGELRDEYKIEYRYIKHHMETGNLKISYLHHDDNGRVTTLADTPPTVSRYYPSGYDRPHSEYTVVLWEEAERFAKQYRADSNKDVTFPEPPAGLKQETVSELDERVKLQRLPSSANSPAKDLLKALVAHAAWELKNETGKFPQNTEVINKLRHKAKTEDQAGAIIKKVNNDGSISTIGREKPIAFKTVKNWLTAIKKNGQA